MSASLRKHYRSIIKQLLGYGNILADDYPYHIHVKGREADKDYINVLQENGFKSNGGKHTKRRYSKYCNDSPAEQMFSRDEIPIRPFEFTKIQRRRSTQLHPDIFLARQFLSHFRVTRNLTSLTDLWDNLVISGTRALLDMSEFRTKFSIVGKVSFFNDV